MSLRHVLYHQKKKISQDGHSQKLAEESNKIPTLKTIGTKPLILDHHLVFNQLQIIKQVNELISELVIGDNHISLVYSRIRCREALKLNYIILKSEINETVVD